MTTQKLKITTAQLEERRLEAGHLLFTTTLSKAEIARRLGVTRAAVTQWAQQLDEYRRGLGGLFSCPHTGRPPRLDKAKWRRILVLLRRGAVSAGFATDSWTLARVQQLIQREFGIGYSKSYLSDKLKSLGWSSRKSVSTGAEPKYQELSWDYSQYSSFWKRRRRWRS